MTLVRLATPEEAYGEDDDPQHPPGDVQHRVLGKSDGYPGSPEGEANRTEGMSSLGQKLLDAVSVRRSGWRFHPATLSKNPYQHVYEHRQQHGGGERESETSRRTAVDAQHALPLDTGVRQSVYSLPQSFCAAPCGSW